MKRKIIEKSDIKIDFVQSYCKYVLFNDELIDYLPYFEEKQISVINSAPLAMSLLMNSSNIPDWHPASDQIKNLCLNAGRFCEVNIKFK